MVEDWPSNLDNLPLLPYDVIVGSSHPHQGKRPLPIAINAGSRNDTLWTEACRMRRLGLDADEIYGALKVVNRKRCQPPMDDNELRDIADRAAQYQPDADLFPTTETGDAEFFASVFADALRYDHLRGHAARRLERSHRPALGLASRWPTGRPDHDALPGRVR